MRKLTVAAFVLVAVCYADSKFVHEHRQFSLQGYHPSWEWALVVLVYFSFMTVIGLVTIPLSKGLRWPARIGIVLATGVVLTVALAIAVVVNGDR